MFVGEIYPTNNCGDCEVLEIFNSRNVTVRFITTGYVRTNVRVGHIGAGSLKDLYCKSVHGVGFIGEGCYVVSKNKIHTVEYSRWSDMLRRCYSELWLRKYPTYRGCSVHISWLNFQTFAKWWHENAPDVADISKYDLDKDIRVEGNKEYGPDTCSIVPKSANIEHSISSKDWVFLISPNGTKWPVKNVSKFAREHGLDFSALFRLIKGTCKQHKGWRLA